MLHSMTPATSSSGLVPNIVSQQPCIPPNRDDWDHLFQHMFDEYFTPPSTAVSPVQVVAASRAIDLANSPVSTLIDQDAPLTIYESVHKNSTSQGSSSNVRPTHTLFKHLGRWTKDHPGANVIGDPSRSISMRKQLQTDAMWCSFDAFLTSLEPNNFKQAMIELSWIDAMQEEIHEFERLQAKPTKKNLNMVKRIFRYLKGTINMGLWYSKDTDMSLIAYADADADHSGCQDTRRSTLGSAQFLGDKFVSRSCKKQKSIVISSTKAK
uniref:Uncharacterized mitochondrial protein AtMg00810-like n=1 Tax=Tanacetum cinerariifolium TaxID=118510 RepID=A0A699HGZ6_TANCI|nr:uncharacterized mitochondrial protein AtMg00810-like [Tanacetum cinerariifolium]